MAKSKYIKCEKCDCDIRSQGYKRHFNYCKGEGILNRKRYTGRGQSWAKDSKLSEEQKKKISKSSIGKITSEKTKEKLSIILKGRTGGIRIGGGRGKKGWYKNYWCDSSWELAWVIYNLEHNIKFERNNRGFEYIFDNEKHKFFPDFKLDNGEYIEIKGYITNQVKEKIKQFPYKIKILEKNEIKVFIDYVTSKYGNDFIKLYEYGRMVER